MKIKIPTECPACGFRLQLVNDQLFCRNVSCDAQVQKKLEHFCKTLGIKGLGPKSIEKLELQDITEIYYLDPSDVFSVVGEKVGKKLLEEIEKSKQASLATVLESFSIPLLGGTASKKIAQVVSNVSEITEETCKQAGLGEKVTNNLLAWLEQEFLELKEFLPFSFNSEVKSSPNTAGKTVCISGKLQSFKAKSEAASQLAAAGFQCVDSVTKTTNYLVDEENKGSLKRKKAEEYNITIINNLNQFLKENK